MNESKETNDSAGTAQIRNLENMNEIKKEGNKLPQYTAAIIANIASFIHGFGMGWPSPVLPILQSENSPVGYPISNEDSSWLGSLLCLGAMFASPLYSFISQHCSRKLTGYLIIIPVIISWILVIVANSITTLYIARFMVGMGTGAATVFCPLYVTEIAEDSVRGALGTLYALLSNSGILVAYVLGSYIPYNVIPYIALLLSATYVMGFFFMPETPTYHIIKMDRDAASKSLRWLRGRDDSVVESELDDLIASYKERQENEKSISIKKMIASRGTRKALVISLVLVANLQFSGIVAILSYTVNIFMEAGSNLSPNDSTIVVGSLLFAGTFVPTILLDRVGRKILLIVSNLCIIACLGTMGGYFFCKSLGIDVSSYGWLPVLCASSYMVTLTIGVSTIPFLMIPELFSPETRSMAVSISLTIMWLESFIVTKFYPNFADLLGLHACYWFFTACCIVGLLFSIFVVPETRNRSSDSIIKQLNGEKCSDKKECHIYN